MRNLLMLLMACVNILLISCNKEQTTQQSANNRYQFLLNDSNWVKIIDTASINIECIDFDKIYNYQKFIINDTNEYKSMFDSLKWYPKFCTNYQLPTIDFNKYTLLGCVTMTGPSINKKIIYKNNVEKRYLYIINIKITGNEEILKVDKNWLLVPKIPYDYIVEIDTTMDNKNY